MANGTRDVTCDGGDTARDTPRSGRRRPAGARHEWAGRRAIPQGILARRRTGKSPEFWSDFRRGGMAERSMAVVLKTGGIGYDVAVIFCRCVPAAHLQYQAMIP